MLREGILLNNRYELLERIGQGGFSVVWLAADQGKANTHVAVKVYRPDQGLGATDISQFEQEFKLTQSLNDARLLRATEYFVHEDSPCLVLPYMSGGSLYDKIRQDGTLPESRIASLMYQMAGALHYLHTRKPNPILHLDIKPDNILIQYDGTYCLSDFGISVDLRSTLLRGSQLRGESFAYRAPERIQNRGLGTASDIFAFGVLLYECCAGIFESGALPPAMLLLSGMPHPALPAQYSPSLQAIIHACMDVEPAKRPSAAQLEQWAIAFEQTGAWPSEVYAGQTPQAAPAASRSTQRIPTQENPTAPVLSQTAKTQKSSPVPWALAGAGIMMVVVAGIWLLTRPQNPEKTLPEISGFTKNESAGNSELKTLNEGNTGSSTVDISPVAEAYRKHIDNGNKFLREKRFGKAREAFQQALLAKPNDAIAQNLLAQTERESLQQMIQDADVAYKAKHYGQAKGLYTRILTLQPDNWMAKTRLRLIEASQKAQQLGEEFDEIMKTDQY